MKIPRVFPDIMNIKVGDHKSSIEQSRNSHCIANLQVQQCKKAKAPLLIVNIFLVKQRCVYIHQTYHL